MKTKILTQEEFDKEIEKVIYSHPDDLTDDLIEEITDRIAKLFALGFHNDLKIYVVTERHAFCVVTYEGIASVLALIYPGKLPCKRVSIRRLLIYIMNMFTKPHVDGINFGVHGDDGDDVGSFFIPGEKLVREVDRV